MKKYVFLVLLGLLLVLLISACSDTGQPLLREVQDQGAEPYPNPVTGYPAPTEVQSIQGYPAPGEESIEIIATPGDVPAPAADSGVVVGTILNNGQPLVNANLYLAEVLPDDEGIERVASYSHTDSPRAFTDPQGRFVFAGIQPGRYGLVLDVVLTAYLLHQPDANIELLITVSPGEQTDLGTLDYDDIPIP